MAWNTWAQMMQLVARLSTARLLVLQTGDDGDASDGSIELVHESLIQNWPTLRRWLDETHEEAAFIAQLTAAAKQWEGRGQDAGLLWRGEMLDEAVRFQSRYTAGLTPNEEDYLEATIRHSTRSARLRRGAIGAAFVFLIALVAVGAVALMRIQAAEKDAVLQAKEAQAGRLRAESAEEQVAKDRAELKDKLADLQKANAQRDEAMENASNLKALQAMTKNQLVERGAEYQALLQNERAEVNKLQGQLTTARSAGGPSTTTLNKEISLLNRQLAKANSDLSSANKTIDDKNAEIDKLKLQGPRAKGLH